MYVNDELVYLQLQKTGSTHIAHVLQTCLGGEVIGKHQPLPTPKGRRLVLGSIRDPWDWYVSLWAYGCSGRGEVYQRLTESRVQAGYRTLRRNLLHPSQWSSALSQHRVRRRTSSLPEDCYGDVRDPEKFRTWLRWILAEDGRNLLPQVYPGVTVPAFMGFLTYRFLYLFVEHHAWQANFTRLSDLREAGELYQSHGIVDRFIRLEHLEADLGDTLQSLGVTGKRSQLTAEPTNASERMPRAFYYDDKSARMVAEQEALISDWFDYERPTASTASQHDSP